MYFKAICLHLYLLKLEQNRLIFWGVVHTKINYLKHTQCTFKPLPFLCKEEKWDTDLEFRTVFLPLYSSSSYTNALFLSGIQFLQLSPTFNLSSLSISLVLIYSEGKDGIHYLFHTNPSLAMANASLAQPESVSGRRRVQYSTHTHTHACTPTHKKITGQWVQACTHIHSLSLSASPMDTWQQEFTVISLNWSQIIAVLIWLDIIKPDHNFRWWNCTLHVSFLIAVCLDFERSCWC